MGMKSTTTTTWECDRCNKQVVSTGRPCTQDDSWGTLMIDQASGFDAQGHPWAPRMREPLTLCGACIEQIAAFVNKKQA